MLVNLHFLTKSDNTNTIQCAELIISFIYKALRTLKTVLLEGETQLQIRYLNTE